MKYVVTAAQMRALDAATIDGLGIPGAVLMETAGRAVADAVDGALAGVTGGMVAVICGGGNNGGDGFVAARWLLAHGIAAVVYLAAARDGVRGDAALFLAAFEKSGGQVRSIATAEALAAHRADITAADVVVDAVFGTGLGREVTGHLRAVIEAINAAAGRIIAVDVPSGMNADTGQPMGIACAADTTVTMAFAKIGLATSPGFARAGEVTVADIGIPEALAAKAGIDVCLMEAGDARALLPRRSVLAHKGSRGHVVAIAGSPGKRGAGRLVASACLRAGAGLVTLASPWRGAEISAPDPVMTAELDPDAAGDGGSGRLAEILAMTRARAVVVGPGMPVTAGGQTLAWAVIENGDIPAVVDADALNHAAEELERIARAKTPLILTPHPGEAARLLGTEVAAIEGDRVAAIRELCARTGKVVVLKGARTLVGDSGGITINPTGNPGLATAGTGDVLAGVCAALLAQGLGPGHAARLAVYVHGLAGDGAAARLGEAGVTASDVVAEIPGALCTLS